MVKKKEILCSLKLSEGAVTKHNTNVIIKVNKNEKHPFIRLTKPLIKRMFHHNAAPPKSHSNC